MIQMHEIQRYWRTCKLAFEPQKMVLQNKGKWLPDKTTFYPQKAEWY